jgi:hypothetical protein
MLERVVFRGPIVRRCLLEGALRIPKPSGPRFFEALPFVHVLVVTVSRCIAHHVAVGFAPRAAVAVSRLPRGNQIAASTVVVRRGLTVRQTDSLVQELLERDGEEARADLLARRLDALALDTKPGLRAPRAVRSEADAMALDVARAHAIAARLETRLLASPLGTFTPGATELLREALGRLAPVLRTLDAVIGTALGRQDAA